MVRKSKSKLGCLSSLFLCFSSKSKAATELIDDVEDDDDMDVDDNNNDASPTKSKEDPKHLALSSPFRNRTWSNDSAKKNKKNAANNNKTKSPPELAKKKKKKGSTKQVTMSDKDAGINAPRAGSVKSVKFKKQYSIESGLSGRSGKSGKSSVYFDAIDDSWHSLGGESFHEDFVTLHLDGQYYFNAMDDPTVSKSVFEGIHMYPRLPTTTLDPLPESPISMTNMDTLLHNYQHRLADTPTKLIFDEADAAAGRAGSALERQAKRLMVDVDDGRTSSHLVDSTNLLLKELKMVGVREKGFPGELTEIELEAVKLFRSELERRDPIYNEIVHALSSVEMEAYALCRFLRARKFDVEKVFGLLDEAKEYFIKAKEHDFYPDLEQALGVSRSIFLSQYPAVFYGNAKNGCPVLYLRLGLIRPEGVKCLITLDKADRFFWNDVLVTWTDIIKAGRRTNPQSIRTESVLVYDMKGVSRSLLNNDTFDMIKTGNYIMASFPETLHCLMVINVPGWFGMAWSVIKKLIDPRTASKIEILTNTEAGLQRLNEMIDKSQIPLEYNGTGSSLAEAAASGGESLVVLNQLMNLTKKQPEINHDFDLKDDKEVTLTVYTRCKEGAIVTVSRTGTSLSTPSQVTSIVGSKDSEPYSVPIGTIMGPGSFTVKLKANSEQAGVFLLLGSVQQPQQEQQRSRVDTLELPNLCSSNNFCTY